jgi:hypothetical protein
MTDVPLEEPCYECECCGLWQDALQMLRDHAARHVAGELRLAPCHPECLVCAEVEWQQPAVEMDEQERADMLRTLAEGVTPE